MQSSKIVSVCATHVYALPWGQPETFVNIPTFAQKKEWQYGSKQSLRRVNALQDIACISHSKPEQEVNMKDVKQINMQRLYMQSAMCIQLLEMYKTNL